MATGNDAFVTEAFVLLALAWIVIFLRTYARASSVGIKKFQLDDYWMLVAGVAYALETATAYAVGAWWKGLANSGMTPEQRQALDPSSEEYRLRVGGAKTQLVGWPLYTFILWSLKLCMCVFYARVTNGLSHMKLRINIGYGVIAITYVVVLLSILLGCHPLHKNWQIHPDPGNHCQPAISRINLIVTVVLNVLTDLYLISIPIPLLWTAQLSWKRKSLLLLIFGGGFFVMACGILRCILVLTDPVSGAQQSGYWAVRETFAAVVVDNVPMIYPLFVKIFRRVETSMGSYHASRAKSPSGTSTTLGNSIRSPMSGKVNRFLHPLSLRHGVTSDSPRSFDDMDMDMAKGGRNIMIVKESTVDVRPKSSDEESRHEERPLHNADNGYAATCNPEPPSSRRKQDS